MKRLYYAAHLYMIVGLLSGLAYREVTKFKHFTGETQLGLVHTHVLALGMLFFLIVMALEKLFTLSAQPRLFAWFFWVYNAGLAVTVTMMVVHGTQTVFGRPTGELVPSIAGAGHTLLAVGLVLLFIGLGKRISADPAPAGPPTGRPEMAEAAAAD